MNYDNHAARLLSLIKQGKEISSSEKCRDAWKILLGGDNATLMKRLGRVMELPELTINAMRENFPHQVSSCSHWEERVQEAFLGQNLNGQWGTFIGCIDSHSINYLQLVSDLLQSKSNTKPIIDTDINQIRDEIEKILLDCIDSDIDIDVKKFLVRNLRKIINSIEEYHLTGSLPLLDAVDSAIGHAHLNKSYKNFLTDTELGKHLLNTLSAMANVVTVAVGLPQLNQAIALISK